MLLGIAMVWMLTGNHQIAAYRDSMRTGDNPPLLFQLDQVNSDVRFIVVDNFGINATATYLGILTIGNWFHVAGVRQGNTLNVYVNGIEGALVSRTLGPISVDNLKIGALLTHGAPVTHFFNGFIDDVRIYNRALSAEEVLQLYQDGL